MKKAILNPKDIKVKSEDFRMNSSREVDETLYFPRPGENGEENTIIVRLLPNPYPTPYDRQMHIAMWYEHRLSEGSQFSREVCATSFDYLIGDKKYKCPICEKLNEVYPWHEDMSDEDRKKRNALKRKRVAFANALILKDDLHPQMEGKVVKMYLQYQVLEYILTTIEGTQDKDGNWITEPQNPFDPYMGKKLLLFVSKNKIGGWPDFKKIEFLDSYPLGKTDEEIMKVFEKCYDLWEELIVPRVLDKVKDKEAIQMLLKTFFEKGDDDNIEDLELAFLAKKKKEMEFDKVEEEPVHVEKSENSENVEEKKVIEIKEKTMDIDEMINNFDPNEFLND